MKAMENRAEQNRADFSDLQLKYNLIDFIKAAQQQAFNDNTSLFAKLEKKQGGLSCA